VTWREHKAAAARQYLCYCLVCADNNVAAAARIAGCNRTHFFRLLRKYVQRKPVGNEHWRALQ